MTHGLLDPTLNLYTPQAQSPEQLLAEFIDRKDVLKRILDILRRNTRDKPQQHAILLGPRGMGKTTLLCAIRHSVNRDPALNAEWLPLQFFEEQYNIGDLADFWLECLRHLEQEQPLAVRAAEQLLDSNPADLAEQAQARFFELLAATGKRALLLVDNLHEIFAAIDDGHALHQLRALWMTDPRMTVIGAAPSYFEEITDVDQAFHDFFRAFTLERLNQAELETCLRRYAEILQDDIVPQVIERSPERVAALRILTGGNPRLVKLGYRVLREGLDGDVRSDLERLLDEATPFFKHRIDSLAKEARRAFDAIAKRWDPVTVDDIRRELRKPSNYVSVQIKRLIDEGFVEEAGGDKKKRYQVSERFYNLYYLWRLSRDGRKRLRWLVGFMRVFYGPRDYREWSRRLEKELAGPLSEHIREEKLAYLHAMCAAAEGNERAEAFDVLIRDAISRNDRQALDEEAREGDPVEIHGWRYLLAEVVWLLEPTIRRQLSFNPSDFTWWHELKKRLLEHDILNIADRRISELGGWRMDTARHALATGMLLEWLSEENQGQADVAYSKAVELDPRCVEAWQSLGISLLVRVEINLTSAETAFNKSIELDPENTISWCMLGNIAALQNNFSKAESAYLNAISFDPEQWDASIRLGWIYLINQGRIKEGIEKLIYGLSLNPKDFNGRYLLVKHWQAALPPAAAKIAANISGADNLREALTEVLLERAAAGETTAVRDALQALDDAGQAIFEPLLLALQAMDDPTILYRIAREKRDLVQDVMKRIAPGPQESAS